MRRPQGSHTRLTPSPVPDVFPFLKSLLLLGPSGFSAQLSPLGVSQQTCFIPPAICGVPALSAQETPPSLQPHPVSQPHEQSGQQSSSPAFFQTPLHLQKQPQTPS